jgi:hypothetical protein
MSNVTAALRWIELTRISGAIRQSDWAVMALEAVHLIGLALLGGSAVMVGLAALRRGGLRGITVAKFVNELRLLALAGLVLMVGSGGLIALSMPFKYYHNVAFQWKMLLLAGAVTVTLLLSRASAGNPANSAGQRVLALLSLALWLGVGFSGRLIGFL